MLALAFALALAADTTTYVVLNHGRPAGELVVVADTGQVAVRYHHYDRQRGNRLETRYRLAGNHIVAGETWTLPLYGPAPEQRPAPADRFETVRDSVFWRAGDSTRAALRTSGSYYRLRNETLFDQAMLARHLLGQPDRSAALLPSGSARIEIVADTILGSGRDARRLRLAMVHTAGAPAPGGVWLDANDQAVASQVGWFITVRRGSEGLLPALRAIELAYRNAQGAALARRLAPPVSRAIAIINGNVLDVERGVLLPRTHVLIRGERIVEVSPTLVVPADARVVDAAGQTVMPGLWDMHGHTQHVSQSARAASDLAQGITTVRDLAADMDVAVSHRDRAARGDIVSPRLILGGFLEGPGHWAGPSEAIISTEADARAWIARYDSLGYRQIKLYNLVHPDLVPVIAEDVRRRGLRLSGHIPRGLTAQTAVRLGFDEINHAAFLFSTFFQDSLYWPRMRAYSTVSQVVAPHVDVNGSDVTALITLLRQEEVVVDGTWQLWLSSRSAAASSSLGIPSSGGADLAARADSNYLRLLKRLFDAGVTLVAGTDGADLRAELELYERAGIPAPDVLRIATLTPARVMREEAEYGSVAAGKVADLMIVDGNPLERIADLRKVRTVVRAGRVYESAALRAAIGQRQPSR